MKTLKTLAMSMMLTLAAVGASSKEAQAARVVIHAGPVLVATGHRHVHSAYCVHGNKVWVAGHWKRRHGVRVWVPGHWRHV